MYRTAIGRNATATLGAALSFDTEMEFDTIAMQRSHPK